MDYDRIVLMKDGQVLEIGPPQELLKDKCSHFRAMAMDAGISINCSWNILIYFCNGNATYMLKFEYTYILQKFVRN